MIKYHGKEGGSIMARIKRAEETLVNLNSQYAKLISFWYFCINYIAKKCDQSGYDCWVAKNQEI